MSGAKSSGASGIHVAAKDSVDETVPDQGSGGKAESAGAGSKGGNKSSSGGSSDSVPDQGSGAEGGAADGSKGGQPEAGSAAAAEEDGELDPEWEFEEAGSGVLGDSKGGKAKPGAPAEGKETEADLDTAVDEAGASGVGRQGVQQRGGLRPGCCKRRPLTLRIQNEATYSFCRLVNIGLLAAWLPLEFVKPFASGPLPLLPQAQKRPTRLITPSRSPDPRRMRALRRRMSAPCLTPRRTTRWTLPARQAAKPRSLAARAVAAPWPMRWS